MPILSQVIDPKVLKSLIIYVFHNFLHSYSHLLFSSLLEVIIDGQVVNMGNIITKRMNICLFTKPIQFMSFSSIQVLVTWCSMQSCLPNLKFNANDFGNSERHVRVKFSTCFVNVFCQIDDLRVNKMAAFQFLCRKYHFLLSFFFYLQV